MKKVCSHRKLINYQVNYDFTTFSSSMRTLFANILWARDKQKWPRSPDPSLETWPDCLLNDEMGLSFDFTNTSSWKICCRYISKVIWFGFRNFFSSGSLLSGNSIPSSESKGKFALSRISELAPSTVWQLWPDGTREIKTEVPWSILNCK